MSLNNSRDRFRRFSQIHSIATPLVTLRRPQLFSQCHVPDKRCYRKNEVLGLDLIGNAIYQDLLLVGCVESGSESLTKRSIEFRQHPPVHKPKQQRKRSGYSVL